MCEPVSIITGATAVLGAYQQKQESDYNEAVQRQNARISEGLAQEVERRGARQETDYRIRIKSFKGGQRTAVAASGLEMSGSALDILEDTAATAEEDVQNIRLNAARDAYGYRTQGLNFQSQADLTAYSGQQRMAGTILSGAASTYSSYQQFSTPTRPSQGNNSSQSNNSGPWG